MDSGQKHAGMIYSARRNGLFWPEYVPFGFRIKICAFEGFTHMTVNYIIRISEWIGIDHLNFRDSKNRENFPAWSHGDIAKHGVV